VYNYTIAISGALQLYWNCCIW